MKKLVAILMIAAFVIPAFADDAQTLPKGVLRTYLTTAYASGDQAFNADGDKVDGTELKALNLGTAIEFGVTDWISAGIQWAPGANVWSEYAGDADMTVNGLYDIKVGAKVQIIGEKAPVQVPNVRMTVTPGVKIPLPGTDWAKQLENAGAGDSYIVADAAKHALALGGQLSFDYVINDAFFLNLFGEYMKYLPRKDAASSLLAYQFYGETLDYDYGYAFKLEFEPHYELALGAGKLSLGLPVTYDMFPETVTNDVGNGLDGYTLSLSPSASYFFMAGPIPLDLKLGYTLPVMGKNASILNTAVFQIKCYLKF
ncbi:MAG: hypothetical protein CVV47_00915 [Spirochaetae bacterium HGW-Spirochaetae-3]|nr:MAG: hypothetical protein CVV47_00915 [Spirochaetae bacterium HGW-Spirochaetae-3]